MSGKTTSSLQYFNYCAPTRLMKKQFFSLCVAIVRLASMRAVEVNKLNDLLDGHFELFDSLWSHE